MEDRGGPWTAKKLARVRDYLIAYQDVMLNQHWVETIYIDAFCGRGRVRLRDSRDFTEGSALQAIRLDRPFSKYHLIEKSRTSLGKLANQIKLDYPDRIDKVEFHVGDVNEVLPSLVSTLSPGKNRAVIFADPYGMQLDWSTVEAVAKQPIIDFWLLVPTGMGLSRLLARDPKRMQRGWSERLDRFLGETGWRDRWYQPTGQISLFGDEEDAMRTVTLNKIVADFQARLRSVFPCVADNVLHLRNGNVVLFSLMFACSNQSLRAHTLAKRIANHLLRE